VEKGLENLKKKKQNKTKKQKSSAKESSKIVAVTIVKGEFQHSSLGRFL
jgi:hypothetical protein